MKPLRQEIQRINLISKELLVVTNSVRRLQAAFLLGRHSNLEEQHGLSIPEQNGRGIAFGMLADLSGACVRL